MFMTKKRHHKEMEKMNTLYQQSLQRVSEYHQKRESKVMSILTEWQSKFKNVSATKALYAIYDILTKSEDISVPGGSDEE